MYAAGLSLVAIAGSSTPAGAELVDSTRIVAIDTAVNPASPDSPIAQEAREMYYNGHLLTTYAEKRDYGNKEINSYSVGCAATGNGVVKVIFSPSVQTYDIKTRQLVPKADFGDNNLQAKFVEADGFSAEYDVVSGSPNHVRMSFSNVETGDKVTLYYSTANGQNMETETVSLDQCAMEKVPEVPTTTTPTTVPTVETTPTTVPTTEVSIPPIATKPTLPETGIESGAEVGVAALLLGAGAALSGLARLLKRHKPRKTA